MHINLTLTLLPISIKSMSQTYEVEVKILLGSSQNTDSFKQKLVEKFPNLKSIGQGSQKNFYFNLDGDFVKLTDLFSSHSLTAKDNLTQLHEIVSQGQNFSMRTRVIDGSHTLFILKYSINDNSSHNGTVRRELEFTIESDFDTLNELIAGSGFTIQAKWSRSRQEYQAGGYYITLDQNAGYGYLAEVEKQVKDAKDTGKALEAIRALIKELGFEELDQARLERMFAYYNQNWPQYYGTDKIFNIE
jgi:predicted adenylyl cyclase CyaB